MQVKIVRGRQDSVTPPVSATGTTLPKFVPQSFFADYPDFTDYSPKGHYEQGYLKDFPLTMSEFIFLCQKIIKHNIKLKIPDPNIFPNRAGNYLVSGRAFRFHGRTMSLQVAVHNRDDGTAYCHSIELVSGPKYEGGEHIHGRYIANGTGGGKDLMDHQFRHPETEGMLLDFIREAQLRNGKIDL